MTIPQLHMYDLKTGEYTGSRDATRRPNGEYMLEATGATPVALPADIPAGHIARWTGDAWEAVEDHRQHMDERGRKEGTTPGVGLGLAICRAIMQAHGGSIRGETRATGGASFRLTLPRGEPPSDDGGSSGIVER